MFFELSCLYNIYVCTVTIGVLMDHNVNMVFFIRWTLFNTWNCLNDYLYVAIHVTLYAIDHWPIVTI